MTDWNDVGQALVGSWPSQVASWGRSAVAAYCNELQARGLSPEQALAAIRTCPADQKFPPSAPEMAALAYRDPDTPTFEECFQQVYGPGGLLGVKRSGIVVSEWVRAFARQYGIERLRMLPVDGDHGQLVRRDLERAYAQFLESTEKRQLAEIVTGRTGRLGRPDFARIGGGE